MRYVSTRDNSKEYSFEDVFIKGLADDGGLYVPTSLKKFTSEELSELKSLNYNDLSTKIINQFFSKDAFQSEGVFCILESMLQASQMDLGNY